MDPSVGAAVRAAYLSDWARIVATIIRVTGDWDVAEDAAAGAFERALVTWPRDGVPRNPAAWLTTAARNLALDRLRRRGVETGKLREWMSMEQSGPRVERPASSWATSRWDAGSGWSSPARTRRCPWRRGWR